jgi:hypothetical protein
MTRAEQKANERRVALDFLDAWAEGVEWRLVEECDGVEHPDVMFVRADGSEAVGVEVTRAVLEELADAKAMSQRVAAEIEAALRKAGAQRLSVLLSFANASALAFRGKGQAAKIQRIADLLLARLPLTSYVSLEEKTLARLRIVGITHIMMLEGDELCVVDSGGVANGPRIGVVQPFIDKKVDDLPTYRASAEARASRLIPPSTCGGVWLIVSLFDGPGFSGSISSHGAEHALSRRGFDRAFVLDYFRGERCAAIEIVGDHVGCK